MKDTITSAVATFHDESKQLDVKSTTLDNLETLPRYWD
jgi:hypothetical protein